MSEKLTDYQKRVRATLSGNSPGSQKASYTATELTGGKAMEVIPVLGDFFDEAQRRKDLMDFLGIEDKDNIGQLSAEYLIREVAEEGLPGTYAMCTLGDKHLALPLTPRAIKDKPKNGDAVWVHMGSGMVVAKRTDMGASAAKQATVEQMLPDGQALISHKGGSEAAFIKDGVTVKVGDLVLYDDLRRMVIGPLTVKPSGEDILCPLAEIDAINLNTLGEVNDVVAEMTFRATSHEDFAEFSKTLGVRASASYLLCGPTGTGKTTALKIVARRLADHVESLTGERISRLVVADPATFYTPYFGETEIKIKSWFRKLREQGKLDLKHKKTGKPVTVPLLIVIEEAEALFRNRGDCSHSSHLFDRPLSLMLSEASSLAADSGIPSVMAITSNRPSLIDAAAMRRFGMRRVNFLPLDQQQTLAILEKKLPNGEACNGQRERLISEAMAYLFEEGVPLADIKFSDKKVVPFCRSHFITPAVLEEAVSMATDKAMQASVKAGKLCGLEPDVLVESLDRYYQNMAETLTPDKVEEYLPHWFTDGVKVTSVVVK